MARILIVLSGSDHWTLSDGTRHPTGYWAEEFVEPHRAFRGAGMDVVPAVLIRRRTLPSSSAQEVCRDRRATHSN
jgi:hypothetical protein